MPTWLTGALVSARITWSASDGPRNTQTSPVRVSSTALSSASWAMRADYGRARLPIVRLWKLLGLAGLTGVAATGVVLARNERQRRAYTPDDVRARLHERHANLPEPAPVAAVTPQQLTAGRMHRLAR